MKFQKKTGFTLLELIVIVTILALLAGILIPVAKQMIRDAKAQRLIEVMSRVQEACQRFWIDTGKFPVEGRNDISEPEDPAKHNLSMNDPSNPISGWKGPYISQPLDSQDNSIGGMSGIFVNQVLYYPPRFDGFDFDNGQGKLQGPGSFLMVWEVDRDFAKYMDEKIDKSDEQGIVNWAVYGRVAYDDETHRLFLFLLAEDSAGSVSGGPDIIPLPGPPKSGGSFQMKGGFGH